MPITERQREQRRKHLGASDIPVMLGLVPQKSAYDLWLEKTGQLEPQPETEAMRLGTLLEPIILDEAERELGKLLRNQYRRAKGLPIAANCDAILRATGEPVEAKSSGITGPVYGPWGDADTDEVPDSAIVQVQVQMLCTKADIAHIMAWVGSRVFVRYRVQRNESLIAQLVGRAKSFWACVEANVPPSDSHPTLETLKRVRREPESVVNLPDDLLRRWKVAAEVEKMAKSDVDGAKAAILEALGTAEAGVTPMFGTMTYLEQTRHSLDTKRLKADHPEIGKTYDKATTFRVLRHKQRRDDDE